MGNLYELNHLIENFEFDIDEETGEILNAAELDNLQMDFNEKIENLGFWYKNLNADIDAYKKEIESFKEKKRVAENRMLWIKRYVMGVLRGEKFKTPRITISYRKSEQVVVPDNLEQVDKKYIKEKIEYTADKNSIKEAIKNGEHVKGCYIDEIQNVIIK